MPAALRTRTTSSRGYAARQQRRAAAETRTSTPTLAELIDQRYPIQPPRPPALPVDDVFTELERRLPATGAGAQVAMQRLSAYDFEARTIDGTVGRGSCWASAAAALLAALT